MRAGDGPLLRLRALSPSGGSFSHPLPAKRWALSLRLGLSAATRAALSFGRDAGHVLRLSRGQAGSPIAISAAKGRVSSTAGGGGAAPVRLQAVWTRRALHVSIDGRRLTLPGRAGARLALSVRRGELRVDDLLATASSRRALLLHRLSDLQARLPRARFLVGADSRDRLHTERFFWTRGFLAGALWHAAGLTGSRLFRDHALQRTLTNIGEEQHGSHDLGFVYGGTSMAGYRRLCRSEAQRAERLCRRLRSSALAAARSLVALAQTNEAGGTIPNRAPAPLPRGADTLIDSMMNLELLFWASDSTGDRSFRDLADRHARRVASLLVRADGSTAQSVHDDPSSGRVLRVHTHQGLSPDSTWARGQGWAVYGFTSTAAALHDRALLAVAERTAGWVARHQPKSGVPRYDYAAGPGEPVDTSAGVITAAGLFRLAALCRRWPGACAQPKRWRPIAERMLASALGHVSDRPPLGFLGDQVGTYGGPAWDDDAELVYGLNYAMEALALSRGR